MYLTHPGIVANDFFPVPWYLMWAYRLAIVVSRWLGSPWHTIDSYTGARSAAWLALQGQEELDDAEADRVKWGSASGGRLQALIKKTEVEGWGWTGRVEGPDADAAEEGIVGVLRRSVGRRRDAADPTAESLAEFEEVGADVWEQLEELREEWEEILEIS
jgi:3-keto steroid reductase